jgi:hypothetical protein
MLSQTIPDGGRNQLRNKAYAALSGFDLRPPQSPHSNLGAGRFAVFRADQEQRGLEIDGIGIEHKHALVGLAAHTAGEKFHSVRHLVDPAGRDDEPLLRIHLHGSEPD